VFRRLLVTATALAAATLPASPGHAAGLLARADVSWVTSCTFPNGSCNGYPIGQHYSTLANAGGTGFLYVNGVLVTTCSFGVQGSCTTYGPTYNWAADSNGVGCYVATAVTVLLGGDVATTSSTSPYC
jgi:hypothetical protein